MSNHKCGVGRYKKCDNPVEWEVFLGEESDYTCPYLCDEHKREDEKHSGGWWTNQCDARGDITYRRILK